MSIRSVCSGTMFARLFPLILVLSSGAGPVAARRCTRAALNGGVLSCVSGRNRVGQGRHFVWLSCMAVHGIKFRTAFGPHTIGAIPSLGFHGVHGQLPVPGLPVTAEGLTPSSIPASATRRNPEKVTS